MVLIETIPCQAYTLHVVEDAEKYVANNNIDKGQIWCVFDKDDFSADRFNSAIKRTETNSQNNPNLQYRAAWSNQCIEFWFLLHFCFYTSNNHISDYIRFFSDKFKEHGLKKYEKNTADLFEILMKYGNPKQAVKHSKRILKEAGNKAPASIAPATTVHILVEELVRYLPNQVKRKIFDIKVF